MRCEFTICIYQKDMRCILDEISMNDIGMCEDCITVNIDTEYLEIQKREVLQRLHGDEM